MLLKVPSETPTDEMLWCACVFPPVIEFAQSLTAGLERLQVRFSNVTVCYRTFLQSWASSHESDEPLCGLCSIMDREFALVHIGVIDVDLAHATMKIVPI